MLENAAACKRAGTYPCCMLTEVAAFVLYAVGVPDPLQKLHLFYDVLPFLSKTNVDSNPTALLHERHNMCVCAEDAVYMGVGGILHRLSIIRLDII